MNLLRIRGSNLILKSFREAFSLAVSYSMPVFSRNSVSNRRGKEWFLTECRKIIFAFALSSYWFIALFTSVVLGKSNLFAFGLRYSLKLTALYMNQYRILFWPIMSTPDYGIIRSQIRLKT